MTVRDVLWFAFAVVVIAATPWVLIDAGNGVPKRLGVMMKARSVAASPRNITAFGAAASRFAPGVPVVDERLLKPAGR